MTHEDEIKHGIEYLRGIFESGKVLRLSEPRVLGQFNFWYLFVVTAYSKQWVFTLSRGEVSDIPGTSQYQQSALAFAKALEQRFKNVAPTLFPCLSGRLIEIIVEWPHIPWPGRAASYVKVRVSDKMTNEVASCFVTQTTAQDMFELKEDPFQEYPGLVNSIREAVDAGAIIFYSTLAGHPDELQQIKLILGPREPRSGDLSRFLKQKVLSMGFKTGSRNTQVWIADPWDAKYLGVSTQALQQEAELLEAEGFFKLNEEGDFASAARELLLEERARAVAPVQNTAVTSGDGEVRDVFLSHASEDKPFVRELAAELQKRNVSYWFDESEITLGDSLRQAIDEGLRTSRFGVVVLSKQFFAKEWPQWELDGILALEIDRKVLLPVWHGIRAPEIRHYSPLLAGRYAAQSSEGAAAVADKIVAAIRACEV